MLFESKKGIGADRRHMAIVLLVFLLLFQQAFAGVDENAAGKLYKKAKKETISLKWDDGLQLFSELVDTYPGSRYEDDSQFWIGYCLEKKGGHSMEAFLAFSDLIQKFPKSSRVQDAIVHQIMLAENLVRAGRREFKDFLLNKLQDSEKVIRQQAALSLGRLKDERSMAVLESMFDDEDWGYEAKIVVAQMETEPVVVAEASETTESRGIVKKPDFLEFGVKRQEKTQAEKPQKSFKEKWDERFFYVTKRHKLYRSLLRDEGKWTPEDLIDYGMWMILPTDQSSDYLALDNYDKKEWFRKYWKLKDPTPTTDTNEALHEFKRRVEYAHKNYGECWEAKKFQFRKDKHLGKEWAHAPWDARGELYVRYGEPNYITLAGWQQEEWKFDRYSIDFVINRYETNIYQDAINPGPLAKELHAEQLEWVRYNYILNPEFRYEHRYELKPLKDLKLAIQQGQDDHKGEIQVNYSIPVKDLSIQKQDGQHMVQYIRNLVVLDDGMHEVRRYESVRQVTREKKKDLKNLKLIEEEIPIHLEPGQYRVALRIEDVKAKRLGIYVENLEVIQK